MTSVWVVIEAVWDHEPVPIICSTRAKAEAWIAARSQDSDAYRIAEFVLDVQDPDWSPRNTYGPWLA